MNDDFGFGMFVGAIIGAALGGAIAGISTKNTYELEAVANNCGHYVVNQEGAVVFTWKKEKTDE